PTATPAPTRPRSTGWCLNQSISLLLPHKVKRRRASARAIMYHKLRRRLRRSGRGESDLQRRQRLPELRRELALQVRDDARERVDRSLRLGQVLRLELGGAEGGERRGRRDEELLDGQRRQLDLERAELLGSRVVLSNRSAPPPAPAPRRPP